MNRLKKVLRNRGSISSASSASNSLTFASSPRSTISSSEDGTSVESCEPEKRKSKGNYVGAENVKPLDSSITGKKRTSTEEFSVDSNSNKSIKDIKDEPVEACANRSNGETDSRSMRGSHRRNSSHNDFTKGKLLQTVQHLASVTNKTYFRHNIEEVERHRNLERHHHHFQVHHQPVHYAEHTPEQSHLKAHPLTNIVEKHASSEKEEKLLSTIAHDHGHKSTVTYAPVDHQIVDRGEKVRETVHHHIHNIVIPLLEHDVHEYHRIRTCIPTNHVVHEAPIIHQARTLEPISREEFLRRGGKLDSDSKNMQDLGLFQQKKCERDVEGIAEQLIEQLRLDRADKEVTKAV